MSEAQWQLILEELSRARVTLYITDFGIMILQTFGMRSPSGVCADLCVAEALASALCVNSLVGYLALSTGGSGKTLCEQRSRFQMWPGHCELKFIEHFVQKLFDFL